MNKKLVLLSACLLTAGTMAAQKRVTGHVADANGDPIVGAAVKVEGTKLVTRTDAQGNFTFNALPASAKHFVISYIGMDPQTVSVTGNLNIVLRDNQLEQAVVVGYGTARKMGTVVGTVSKVSSDKIENKPVTTALDALQGKVAGVQIMNNTGDVGQIGQVQTTVRGEGSLNGGNAPLYVIDGMPVSSTVFYMMNPNDIESYSVMRDASATSIYGSRAANGVIFVTTKRGRRGERAQIKIGQSIGWSMLARRIGNPMSSNQLLDFYFSNGAMSGSDYVKYKQSGVNTDWQKYNFRDSAPVYNTNFSVSGATDRTSYYISGSYMKKEALTDLANFKRYTARVNVDTRATDWFRTGVNIGLNYDERSPEPNAGKGYIINNPTFGVATLLPFVDPYAPDGSKAEFLPYYNTYPNFMWKKYNPYKLSEARLVGTAFAELTPIEGLTLKSQFGADLMDHRGTSIVLPSIPWANGAPNKGSRSEAFSRSTNFTITNTAEYKWKINKDNNLTFLLGQEGIKQVGENFSALDRGQNDDRLVNFKDGNTVKVSDLSNGRDEVQYLSFFGRLDYDLMHKYYANFTLRNDQASKFGADNRSATFASGGLMWKMKEEEFLKNVHWLDDLRLKVSVGSTGNSQGIGAYQSLGTVGQSHYAGRSGWYLATPENKELGWETQIQTTFGVSTRIFNRANVELNYYIRKTKDMLMDVPVPYTTGFSSQALNIGQMSNRGIELQFDVDAVKNWNGLNVNIYGNLAYNVNKIDKLFYGLDEWELPDYGLCYVVGKSVNFYMPERVGVDPADGKPYWAVPGKDHKRQYDENGKLITTKDYSNPNALCILSNKKMTPPVNGGFGATLNWKGLTLNADFTFVLGKYMVNTERAFTMNSNMTDINKNKDLLDAWQKPGDKSSVPGFGNEDIKYYDTSRLQNSSFLRLKNLSLSYDLPASWMDATGFIKNVRLSAAARNLLTFTKWDGADPEYSNNMSGFGAIPNTREYTLGVEFTF